MPADSTQLDRYLSTLADWRTALREQSMIYQADLKTQVATHYHRPPAEVFALVYADWAALRDRYLAETTTEEAPDA